MTGSPSGGEHCACCAAATRGPGHGLDLGLPDRIFDSINDGIAALDLQGRFTMVNRRFCEMTGYAAAELVGAHFSLVVAEESLPAIASAFADLITGDAREQARTDLTRKDGAPVTILFNAWPLMRDGKVIGVAGTAADVSERQRAEEQLRESEARYRTLTENMFDMMCELDSGGRFTYVSPNFRTHLGYEPASLLGSLAFDIIHPEDRQRIAEEFRAVMEQPDPGTVSFRVGRTDGSWCWVECSANFTTDDDGERHTVVVVRDIEEKMALVRTLGESEERLRTFMNNAPVILFAADADGVFTLYEGRGLERVGLHAGQFVGRRIVDVHADNPRIVENTRRALAGEEFTDLVHIGELVFEVAHTPLRGEHGGVTGFAGVLLDVTERHRAEDAVRARTAELEEMYGQLTEAHAQLEQSKSDLEDKSAQLERALQGERERSRRDALTGKLNHAAITDRLRDLIDDPAITSVAIAMVDVDGLKAANDTYGHPVGDALLITVADALSRDGAEVGRYGGDEFVALLPGVDRPEAERYREAVLQSLDLAGLQDPHTGAALPVVASIGLAIYPEEAAAVDDLIRLSDSAMYASRRERPRTPGGGRSLGGDRAARMVGELVPLLTSPGLLPDKLRLVAHRLSVGAGYDAVNFVISGMGEPSTASSVSPDVPAGFIEQWTGRERSAVSMQFLDSLLRARRPLIFNDLFQGAYADERERTMLTDAGLRSGLAAPMIWEDTLIGVISIASRAERAFTARDAEFIGVVATQVTAIVGMSVLLEQLRRSHEDPTPLRRPPSVPPDAGEEARRTA